MNKHCREAWHRTIFRSGERGYRQYRIPAILPLADRRLLLACEARREDRGDWGDIDILVLRMTDGGAPEQVLKIGASQEPPNGRMRTHNNPVLIPDGPRVHLIYHKNYAQAFLRTSWDDGRSWSAAREITQAYRAFPCPWNVCATGPGHGVRLPGGRLVVPVWLANGKTAADGETREHWPSVSGVIYSDDHGETWRAGAWTDAMVNANETAVARLSGDRLLFSFRNMNADRRRRLGLSMDGGETFSRVWKAEALTDPMCYGGMSQAEDTVWHVHCDSEAARENLTLRHTPDAGRTWPALCLVDPVGGYADIAALGDRLYVFYERYDPGQRLVLSLVVKAFSIGVDAG